MSRNAAASEFNEIVALLRRNATGDLDDGEHQRDVRDLEDDLKRLLLMSRDARQRDQMIQAQAVRQITMITKQSSTQATRYCAAILCNLAQTERGRLSASSCDRWHCVSHRHNCPLAMLMATATGSSSDIVLRQLSAAALLSFSVQNECQLQLDAINSIPQLLTMLQDTRDDGDFRVFIAAILWNLTKSPLLMLKLETVHGMLKDRLMRTLTDVLWTPLEPFQLSVTPTGERGTSGLLESNSADNLGVMVAASTSTQLAIVLRVENYVGKSRSLSDQYRAKTPSRKAGNASTSQGGTSDHPSQGVGVAEGLSVSNFDESGVLKSRSCAVCGKNIKLKRKPVNKKTGKRLYVQCACSGCEQTFHVTCCRWKSLSDERLMLHASEFRCASCMVQLPSVHYCDFIADATHNHELLVTETRFKSVAIQRATSSSTTVYSALLDRQTLNVVAVGVKQYRIPASSQDIEMFVVHVCYSRTGACPATQLQMQSHVSPLLASVATSGGWTVSYARDGATQLAATPGSAVFWPGLFLQDLDPAHYTQRSLGDLEAAFLYEFQGGSRQETMFAIGEPIRPSVSPPPLLEVQVTSKSTAGSTTAAPPGLQPVGIRLWTTMHPRRAICMKMLTEQLGKLKQLNDVAGHPGTTASTNSNITTSGNSTRKKPKAKPHITGRKLSRVAIAVE